MASCREESKASWRPHDSPTIDEVKLGCLQRIADATELMAENHQKLIEERDNYKRWYKEERETNDRLWRRIAGLKGHITRLKRGKK